jgi:hypothetical protein
MIVSCSIGSDPAKFITPSDDMSFVMLHSWMPLFHDAFVLLDPTLQESIFSIFGAITMMKCTDPHLVL